MPVQDRFNPCAARRALLLGAGALGVTVVAGCGGDPAEPAANGGATSPAAAGSTSGATNPFDNTGAPTQPGEAAPPTGALVATKEVPVGGGVIAKDTVLVVQPKQGTFKAFKAACPHQGIMVDPPTTGDSVINCPGHNSQFKVADGSLVRGPASRGLNGVPVKVQDGYVVEV
ncbi:Rieske (2Fe-2S) protein [Dactylosporangium sp. NPDC005572]|uniref:Rieske (2Fe-2S) protein n=1 Tax=Dactylosporangium sp. NPDC005572 TaxID=3156889 RepID=UPI00339FB128